MNWNLLKNGNKVILKKFKFKYLNLKVNITKVIGVIEGLKKKQNSQGPKKDKQNFSYINCYNYNKKSYYIMRYLEL